MTPQPRRAPSYGRTTRTLHWLTAVALVAQFTLGYVLDVGGNGRGRGAAAAATQVEAEAEAGTTSTSSVTTPCSRPTFSSV